MKRQPDHKVCISALKDPLSLSINNFEAQKSLSLLFTKQMMQWAMVRKKKIHVQVIKSNFEHKTEITKTFYELAFDT